jgi:hypothetical protein
MPRTRHTHSKILFSICGRVPSVMATSDRRTAAAVDPPRGGLPLSLDGPLEGGSRFLLISLDAPAFSGCGFSVYV